MARVEIEQSGRGGSIHYHEGMRTLTFYWEFGGADVVALLYGPSAAQWPERAPWAAARQQEIFDAVARDVVRQKVPGGRYSVDLTTGTIEIRGA